jgi:hypothetical protein
MSGINFLCSTCSYYRNGNFCTVRGVTAVSPITVALFAGHCRLSSKALQGSSSESTGKECLKRRGHFLSDYNLIFHLKPMFTWMKQVTVKLRKSVNRRTRPLWGESMFTGFNYCNIFDFILVCRIDDSTCFFGDSELANLIFEFRQKWSAAFIRKLQNPNRCLHLVGVLCLCFKLLFPFLDKYFLGWWGIGKDNCETSQRWRRINWSNPTLWNRSATQALANWIEM